LVIAGIGRLVEINRATCIDDNGAALIDFDTPICVIDDGCVAIQAAATVGSVGFRHRYDHDSSGTIDNDCAALIVGLAGEFFEVPVAAELVIARIRCGYVSSRVHDNSTALVDDDRATLVDDYASALVDNYGTSLVDNDRTALIVIGTEIFAVARRNPGFIGNGMCDYGGTGRTAIAIIARVHQE
jgi:hypothetical protein